MQPFKQRYIVLYAIPYRMVDTDTGYVNEGVSIEYITRDNLEPFVDPSRSDRGYKTVKAALPASCEPKLGACPGFYDLTLEMVSNKDRKQEIRVRDMDFVSAIKVSEESVKADFVKSAK